MRASATPAPGSPTSSNFTRMPWPGSARQSRIGSRPFGKHFGELALDVVGSARVVRYRVRDFVTQHCVPGEVAEFGRSIRRLDPTEGLLLGPSIGAGRSRGRGTHRLRGSSHPEFERLAKCLDQRQGDDVLFEPRMLHEFTPVTRASGSAPSATSAGSSVDPPGCVSGCAWAWGASPVPPRKRPPHQRARAACPAIAA